MGKLRSGLAMLGCAVTLNVAVAQDLPAIGSEALPPEARETLKLIKGGGPFPHEKDGAVFRNFEGRLPWRTHGYYSEYTVPTPGVTHRGLRRIVAGKGEGGDVRLSGEYYYTADHYNSFARIRESSAEGKPGSKNGSR